MFFFCRGGKPTETTTIFVGDRLLAGGQQKRNQNCSVFVVYKKGKATKKGKSRFNYLFLFLFLSIIMVHLVTR